MGAFIAFVILIIMAYLVLWTPFVNKLNNEVNLIFNLSLFLDLENEVHADDHTD